MTTTNILTKFDKQIKLLFVLGIGFVPFALVCMCLEVLYRLVYNGYGLLFFTAACWLFIRLMLNGISGLYKSYALGSFGERLSEIKRLKSEVQTLEMLLQQSENVIAGLNHLAIEAAKKTEQAQKWVIANDLFKSGCLIYKTGQAITIDTPSFSEVSRLLKTESILKQQGEKWKGNNNTTMIKIAFLLEKGYRIDESYTGFYTKKENGFEL